MTTNPIEYCLNHPEVPAVVSCSVCAEPFCAACIPGSGAGAACDKCQEATAVTGPSFRRTSVLLVLLFSIITGGVYFPIWYLRRAAKLNALRSSTKLSSGFLVGTLVASIVVLVLGGYSGVLLDMGDLDGARTADSLASLIKLGTGIGLLVIAFRTRRILIDESRARGLTGAYYSGLATFFLSILYLQYKINRLCRGQG